MKQNKKVRIYKNHHVFLHHLILGVLGFFAALSVFFIARNAKSMGNTYTVCPSGCDYATLTDAVAAPGLSDDTIVLTNDYIFDPLLESDNISVPDNVTIQCEAVADTFGDSAENERFIYPGSNFLLQNCTFEYTSFDASGKTDVTFDNNTFSSAAYSQITFTSSDTFALTNNTGVQRLQLQNADNGTIDSNTFDCIFDNICMALVTAGGGPFDYSDPADVSTNIDITNNTITNRKTNSFGDHVQAFAGININFTGNTIQSDPIDDIFVPMLTVQNAEIYIANNYFLYPPKDPGDNNGAWAINIRVSDADANVVAEHNTMIMGGSESAAGGNACLGVFDNGSAPNVQVNITFQYNLCYVPYTNPSGTGINLNYVPGSSTVNLTDSYNGFWNTAGLINDNNAIITSLSNTNLTSDPLMRTENVSTADDYYPSTISRYLDVNGTLDIGAFADVRQSSYTIDQSCTVDYATCHSQTTAVLRHSVRTGDSVTIEEGNYSRVVLDYPASGVTINGVGATTVIDAAGSNNGLSLSGMTNSTIANLQVSNSTPSISESYELSHILYTYNSVTYDQSTAVVGSPDVALVFQDNMCSVGLLSMDNTDVTTAVDAAIDDWNLALVDIFGFKLTILIPDRIASNSGDFITFVTNVCGSTPVVDLFLPSLFTVSGGDYTYNQTAADNAGITLKAGLTNPPTLDHIVTVPSLGAIFVMDSTGNTFDTVTVNNSSVGAYLDAGSANNDFLNSTFSANTSRDIYSASALDNRATDSSFSLSKVQLDGAGDLGVYYTVKADITDAQSGDPIDGATVTVKDNTSATVATLTTNITGQTSYSSPLLAYVLSGTGPYTVSDGGYNPFTFIVSAAGYSDTEASDYLITPQQIEVIEISVTGGSYYRLLQTGILLTSPNGGEIFKMGETATITWQTGGLQNKRVSIYLSTDDGETYPIQLADKIEDLGEFEWIPEDTTTRARIRVEAYTTVQVLEAHDSSNTSFTISGDETQISEDEQAINQEDDNQEQEDAVKDQEILQQYLEVLDLDEISQTIFTINEDKLLLGDDPYAGKCGEYRLVKIANQDTVYFCGRDGKRYIFPNNLTYLTWFNSFDRVKILDFEDLAAIPLGGNVTYKPGSRMLKVPGDKQVYFVTRGGVLHWVSSEAVAKRLYGDAWASFIDDLLNEFLPNYTFGDPITDQTIVNGDRSVQSEKISENGGVTVPSKDVSEQCSRTIAFTRSLILNDVGLEVRALQSLLQCLGYFPQDQVVTGNYGPVTVEAVSDFQAANDLNPLGSVGPATRAKLNEYPLR